MTKDEMQAEITRLQYEVDAIPAIKAERNSLMAAGKLALDALDSVLDFDPDSRDMWSVSGGAFESHQCKEAMESLRKAGVQ